VSYPALRLWGRDAVIYSLVAVIVCLLPATLTLLWSGWALKSTPEQQLLLVLGGTGLRMLGVLGIGLLIYGVVEYFHRESFWIWLLVFYLFTLAVEMGLMLAGRPAGAGRSDSVKPVIQR
jgi:hypothetical protein